jgi:predicted methyltransferase
MWNRLQVARRSRLFLWVAIAVACATAGLVSQAGVATEADRLAAVLGVTTGATIAEIGAGAGEMTVEMAERVGDTGRVYSTELGDDKVESLREAVSHARPQVRVVAGAEDDTRLPAGCCDAIYMRRVYHHFTHPVPMDASLFDALRPGGRLAVIDFEHSEGTPPPGVPANRKGHGVPPKVVVEELTRAGFEHVRTEDWTGGMFLALFRKPPGSPVAPRRHFSRGLSAERSLSASVPKPAAGGASPRSVHSRTSSASRAASTALALRRIRRPAGSTSMTMTSTSAPTGKTRRTSASFSTPVSLSGIRPVFPGARNTKTPNFS